MSTSQADAHESFNAKVQTIRILLALEKKTTYDETEGFCCRLRVGHTFIDLDCQLDVVNEGNKFLQPHLHQKTLKKKPKQPIVSKPNHM